MARKPMVTRTFNKMTVKVMAVDTVAGTVLNEEIALPRTLTEDKAILKSLNKNVEAGKQYVRVLEKKTEEVLYGMSEEDFMKYAEVLPPREVGKE